MSDIAEAVDLIEKELGDEIAWEISSTSHVGIPMPGCAVVIYGPSAGRKRPGSFTYLENDQPVPTPLCVRVMQLGPPRAYLATARGAIERFRRRCDGDNRA